MNSRERHQYFRDHPENIPDHVHGTTSGYTHYSCRCPRCRKVISDYHRARREAKTGTRDAREGRRPKPEFQPTPEHLALIEAAREAFTRDIGYTLAIAKPAGQRAARERGE